MISPDPEPPPSDPEDEGVPAGFGARLVLTSAPFVAAVVIWFVIRWLTR